MTDLEHRYDQEKDWLGNAWGPVYVEAVKDETGTPHVYRSRYYDGGGLLEIDGETWAFPERNGLKLLFDKFRAARG